MSDYDIILIHPPAIYDFRRRPMFPGAMGKTVGGIQFIKPPIGMLSIADYLDRHAYRVIIDNLGDRMVNVAGFDVHQHLKNRSTPIFAIGLHFQQHCQGAIEIARLCKQLHPGALVIMGGLTATVFHDEIIKKYDFVDAVVRGEAEKPLLQLMRSVEKHGKLTATSNLTYRTDSGEIAVTPLMDASKNLDEFAFTRFDLLEPKNAIYSPDECNRWSLSVCRGCTYNCSICGGSAYSFKKHFGMTRPAFRSPAEIVADMKRLNDQDVDFIGLYQDPRMAGESYWRELLATIIKEKPRIERLSLDLLAPADETFIREIAKIGRRVILHLCPDTGCGAVRKLLGRHYSNAALLETIKICHKYHIPVTSFFSVGLAGETEAQVKETWELWEKLDALNHQAMEQGDFGDIDDSVPIGGQVMGPILIDPGSLAFDAPDKHGYKLLYRDLEAYINGLSKPSWQQWLNYETQLLDKHAIVDQVLRSIEFTIDQREKYGFYSAYEAHYERCLLEADRVIGQEMDNLEKLENPREKQARIVAMRRNMDQLEKTRMTFIS